MLIKGCTRRVIFLSDTGSRYFDSAYLVLKPELPSEAPEGDLLTAARALVSQTAPPRPQPLSKPRRSLRPLICAYLAGAATVGVLAGIIALIL